VGQKPCAAGRGTTRRSATSSSSPLSKMGDRRANESKSIIKSWTCSVTKIHVRPIFRTRHQLLSNRILQNVVCFLPPAFVMAQPMLEKIILPGNSDFLGGPFLPLAYDHSDRSGGWRKREERVEMVGHQQEQIRSPQDFL